MKIDQHKELEIKDISGDIPTIEAKIDKSSMSFLFEMMSKSLYSNPIGSIIREITSNCFDSHTEANVDDAVVIDYNIDEEGEYILFKDVGVGLSPQRIKKVYMNYFSSTKRETNDQIGGFGLGSKTPLSYTDYFYISTIFDGTKYEYVFSKGETAPNLKLLNESKTEERNGTEIKIYIKSHEDWYKFQKELKSQLCYFDNVYFGTSWEIENNYRIYETDTFKYRNIDQYSDEMHIVLGKVSYPIDWKELGLKNEVKIPVGVRFEIGELQVTPNRESLRYVDEETKELIRTRINNVVNELISMYKDDVMLYEDYHEYLRNKDKKPHIVLNQNEIDDATTNCLLPVKEDKLYLTGLRQSKAVFKPLHDLGISTDDYNLGTRLTELYASLGSIPPDPSKPLERNWNDFWDEFQSNRTVYVTNSKDVTIQKNIRAGQGKHLFVRKKLNKQFVRDFQSFILFDEKSSDNFVRRGKYFNLGIAKRSYDLYKTLERIASKIILDYNAPFTEDDIENYNEWKQEQYLKKNKKKLEGKISVKDVSLMEEYSSKGRDCYQYDMKLQDLEEYQGFIVYGTQQQSNLLRNIETSLYHFKSLRVGSKRKHYIPNKAANEYNELEPLDLNPKAVRVLIVAQNNLKHFKKKNMINVEEFYSDHRVFRKLSTTFKIKAVLRELFKNQGNYNTTSIINYFRKINSPVGDRLYNLYAYTENFKLLTPSNRSNGNDWNDFTKSIMRIAEENNWYDNSIINQLREVEQWFKGIEILKFIDLNDQSLPIVLKYLYDNKRKINPEYYYRYVKPESLEGQLQMNFEPEEETETKMFKILKQVA